MSPAIAGFTCPAQGLCWSQNGSDSRHNGTVLALQTFFSFWEPEGKSDSIKYNKNNMAFKIRAIYYKSKWPLIICGKKNFFFNVKCGLRSWLEVELANVSFLHQHVCGTCHILPGAGAHVQSMALTAPFSSIF